MFFGGHPYSDPIVQAAPAVQFVELTQEYLNVWVSVFRFSPECSEVAFLPSAETPGESNFVVRVLSLHRVSLLGCEQTAGLGRREASKARVSANSNELLLVG